MSEINQTNPCWSVSIVNETMTNQDGFILSGQQTGLSVNSRARLKRMPIEDLIGTCPICLRDDITIIRATGLLYRHGSRDRKCTGHNMPPVIGSTREKKGGSGAIRRSDRNTRNWPAAGSSLGSIQDMDMIEDDSEHNWTLASSRGFLQNRDDIITDTDNQIKFKRLQGVRVLKRIPKGARQLAAKLLKELLDSVLSDSNNLVAWDRLLGFAQICLASPKRGGKSHNLTNEVKKKIIAYQSGALSNSNTEPVPQQRVGRVPGQNVDLDAARRAAVKIEDGDIKGAMRALTSLDIIAPNNEDTFNKLVAIHPVPHPQVQISHAGVIEAAYQTTEVEVKRAITLFPNGSAGGPDDIRPQHVKDLLAGSSINNPLLQSITRFINLLLSGGLPKPLRPTIMGGNLFAINKKGGGIRPIAVGNVWRRIAGKVASQHVTTKCAVGMRREGRHRSGCTCL